MIDFATLQGLTIPEGVVTRITDASGIAIWSAIKTISVLYLRPSADIFVGHNVYPTGSTSAYLLINEEVSDDNSTYIESPSDKASEINDVTTAPTVISKFKLTSNEELRRGKVLSVSIRGDSPNATNAAEQWFTLEINGVACNPTGHHTTKEFNFSVPEAVTLINEYGAVNKRLPEMTITIESRYYEHVGSNGKLNTYTNGVTQIYVELTVESY